MKWIHKLQEQPDSHKERIVVLTASLVTILIFAIWIVGLSGRFANSSEGVKQEAQSIGVFSDVLSSGIDDFKKESKLRRKKFKESMDDLRSEDATDGVLEEFAVFLEDETAVFDESE